MTEENPTSMEVADATKIEFTPHLYRNVLCEYLEALGNHFLLEKDFLQNKRGSYLLNIRSRLISNVKLTKKQNKVLVIIEKELAKQLKEKGIIGEVENVEQETVK